MNPTNDPSLRSFLTISPESHFPIQNLPYGVFRHPAAKEPCIGVAIGDSVLNLTALESAGFLDTPLLRGRRLFSEPTLNAYMDAGRPVWQEARAAISRLLRADEPTLQDNPSLRQRVLHSQTVVEMLLPATIGDYTDFYSSRDHATNVGIMMRGRDNALQPNW